MLQFLNPFAGRFRLLKGTLETLAAIGGCLGALEAFDIVNFLPEREADTVIVGPAPSTYSYVNAGNLFLNTAISGRVQYTSYDWLNLRTQTPGVVWAEGVELNDSRLDVQCGFQLSGTATLSVSGKPDLIDDAITPTVWDVQGCGVRTMVFYISTTRPPSLGDVGAIAKTFLQDLENQGYTFTLNGCVTAGGFYDYFEYYEISHPAKRSSILEVYLSRPGAGTSNQITVTNHIVGDMEQVLRRGLFEGRAPLVQSGCERLL